DEHPFAGDALSSGTLPRALPLMRVNSARNQVKCNEYGKDMIKTQHPFRHALHFWSREYMDRTPFRPDR
ncbi:MAG: hypothetical protein WB752_21105, partial [Pseudolabrys sp.]